MDSPPTAESPSGHYSLAFVGFLVATFCLVGLMGLAGTYVAPLPYQREMLREETLDQVLRTAPEQRGALREALDDSADAVLTGPGPIEARVAAERTAMRMRFADEARASLKGLRLLILAMTAVSTLVGVVIAGLSRR